MDKKKSFLGIKVDAVNRKDIVDIFSGFSKTGRKKTAFYINAHCVNLTYKDHEYRSILNKADLVYSGGQGVVWASGLLGADLPERVNILDFFDMLAKKLIEEKAGIYLLGDLPDVIEKAAGALKNKGLNIIGQRHGFFNKVEERDIILEINKLKPDILMVGMSVPKQEKWISGHLNELDVNLCWAVGGVFKLLAGDLKRAPRIIIDCGLEWLYIGVQDPARLLKRYLIGNFIFVYRVLNQAILRVISLSNKHTLQR